MSLKPKLGTYLWEQERYMPVSPGRPSTYDAERGRLVVKALMEGLAFSQAANAAGISVPTIYAWRRANEDFNQAVATAVRPGGNKRQTRTIKKARRDDFDNHIANIILDELARGRTMKDICNAEDMPSRMTVHAWAKKRPDFKARIEQCRKSGKARK